MKRLHHALSLKYTTEKVNVESLMVVHRLRVYIRRIPRSADTLHPFSSFRPSPTRSLARSSPVRRFHRTFVYGLLVHRSGETTSVLYLMAIIPLFAQSELYPTTTSAQGWRSTYRGQANWSAFLTKLRWRTPRSCQIEVGFIRSSE